MRREFTFVSTRGNGRRRLFYVTLLILLILLIDMISGGFLRTEVRALTVRLWSATTYVRGAVFGNGYFVSHASLAAENASLRDEVAQYQEDAAGYQVLKQENDSLRSILNLAQTQPGITAPVVSSVISSPYGTFIVGAGTADSVEVGSLVVTEGGFVVGTVSEVGAHTSLVTELFAGGSSVDVLLDGAPAAAEGRGGGNALITLPRGITAAVNDPVTAPGLGGRAVGVVGKVESDPASAVQSVYVTLPVNLSSLRYVYLIPH
jgi:cell shape-determining protein MreC